MIDTDILIKLVFAVVVGLITWEVRGSEKNHRLCITTVLNDPFVKNFEY